MNLYGRRRKVAAGFTAILVVAALFQTPATARTAPPGSGSAGSTSAEPERPVTIEPFYSAENVGPTVSGAQVAPLASSARKPPSSPESDGGQAQQCLNADGALTERGRVHNRFVWCQKGRIGSQVRDRRGRVIGSASFVFEAAGYGRDDGDRSVKIFLRAVPGTVDFDGNASDLRNAIFQVWADCESWLDGCSAGGPTASNIFAGWDEDGSWKSWTVYSSNVSGVTGPDRVSKHHWVFKLHAFAFEAPGIPPISLPHHRIRCDSAVLGFSRARSQACIFDDVVPHLQYSLTNTNYSEVSEHVRCALDPGCATYPQTGPKRIPGKYTGNPDDPGLHRITEDQPVDPVEGRPYYSKNRSRKDQECAKLPLFVYDKTFQQCDEFPFASTLEGAGFGDNNFSLRGVLSRHNSCAGNALANYYRNDRILVWRPGLPDVAQDKYFVEITNVPASGGDECLPPDDSPGEVNLPPTANAGPDTTGEEGFEILLQGSASDPEGEPVVHWTYSLGPDTDNGMSCSFTDSGGANTVMRCTDDGTVTVTLTAFDGVNAAVSDSAVVRVSNVTPEMRRRGGQALIAASPADFELGIVQPSPWQVFRVGDPVPFTVQFEDPGANDTHACQVTWDDGQTSSFDTLGRVCEGSHTFTRPGMYTIKPAITDDDGGVSEAVSVMVIVYDPDGGFATAGGFFESAAGALVSDPAATGRVKTEFNPHYHPDDEGPAPRIGKISARLQGAPFSFDSTALEWLVVTDDGKVAVKATGTLNGLPGYGIVGYGFDASDAVRLVVWPLSAGPYPQQTLVYDNRNGADYDLDLSNPQPLDGGSLHVHH